MSSSTTAPARWKAPPSCRNVVEVFPYQIHTVLTDNGMAFADLPKNRDGADGTVARPHIFDRVCRDTASSTG